MKFNVIIDASSYINLSQDDCYSGRTLLNLLTEVSIIKFSSEVSRREIPHHQNHLTPSTLERSSKVHFLSKRISYKDYELKLFDSISSSDSKNRGEKHNLIVALDNYFQNKKVGLVFLTDDNNALRGCLNDAIYSFPLYQIWNSFDVILFLYIESKRFSKELAETAIKDMNAIMATDDDHMDPRKTQERIQLVKKYIKRVQRISKIKG